MKKYLKIIFVIVVLSIIIATIIKFTKKEDVVKIKSIDISDFYIENRERCLLENSVLIGNNTKELENGYYDLKITYEQDVLKVNLNKLWYENYGEDYIDNEYLAKICREIVRVADINNKDKEAEYILFKHIKENFNNVKQGESVENIKIQGCNIHLENEDGMCRLEIK